MKVAITGAAGQLGRDLVDVFSAGHDVRAWTSADLDVADRSAVRSALETLRPDLVVNAAAYTKVDACEDDPVPAWNVNAAGPWFLAQGCAAVGATLVHVSTDYVFDGSADRPYTEFDDTAPASVYGRTKDAGERLVREALDTHYIVRTSWLHGQHGANFVKTMLRLGADRDELSVVDDQRGAPCFTPDVARAIVDLVDTGAYGTYHRTNSGDCTWYDLAAAAFEYADVSVALHRITTEEFNAPAPRPKNSILDNRKATMLGLPALPHWRDSLQDFLGRIA